MKTHTVGLPTIIKHSNKIIPGLTLLAGILIGRLSAPGPAGAAIDVSEADKTIPERYKSAERSHAEQFSPVTDFQRLRNEIRRAPPGNIAALAHRAMLIPDHNERRLALIEAIHAASPAQCMEIMSQFEAVARGTGRSDYALWASALFETGKIGGSPLLDAWKAQGKTGGDKELQATIYGMATRDPSAALAWLDDPANSGIQGRQTLLNHIIAGAALDNVGVATRMMDALPVTERRAALDLFMWNVIANEGISSAVNWAASELRSARNTDLEYANVVENDIFSRMASAAASNAGAGEMADHVASLHRSTPVSEEQVFHAARQLRGSGGLTLLDNLVGKRVISGNNIESMLPAVRQIVSRSPDEARQWLQDNPNSAIRQTVSDSLR